MKKERSKLSLPVLILAVSLLFGTLGCSNQSASRSITGSGGSVTDSEINRGEIPPTVSPEAPGFVPVVSLTPERQSVNLNDEIAISASAVDPAGGPVKLTWNASDGTVIKTEGNIALWRAPAYGTKAVLHCSAEDSQGHIGSATVEINVIADTTWEIKLLADRSSLLVNSSESDYKGLYIPLSGAKVTAEGTGYSEYSSNDGTVKLKFNSSNLPSDKLKVRVSYSRWDLTYDTQLPKDSGAVHKDEIIFNPGYEDVTVAKATGDSFAAKKGMMEVAPVESVSGRIQPVFNVSVSAGNSTIHSSPNQERALLPCSGNDRGIKLSLSKDGYQPIEGKNINIDYSGVTLVQAKLVPYTNLSGRNSAYISSIMPYNGNRETGISEPIIIRFAQNMAQSDIFDTLEAVIHKSSKNGLTNINKDNIYSFIRSDWKNDTDLYLYPIMPLDPNTEYSIEIKSWNPSTADGRKLKSYTGYYHRFKTVDNPVPHVHSTYPLGGQDNVRRSGPFTLNFDTPMNQGTLYNDFKVVVFNQTENASTELTMDNIEEYSTADFFNNDRTLEFVPKTPLKPHCRYVFKIISMGIESKANKKLQGFNNTWIGFSTGGF